MRRALLISLCAALLAVSPAHAQDNAQRALQGLQTCTDHFPDRLRTIEALKAEGWRFEGNRGGAFNLFSLNGRRVLAAIRGSRAKEQGCFVAVSKLTTQQAISLAEAYLRNKQSVVRIDPAQLVPVAGGDVAAAWAFKRGNRTLVVAVSPPQNFRIMRGAAVLMVEP